MSKRSHASCRVQSTVWVLSTPLDARHHEASRLVYFLDEVQLVDGWQRWLRRGIVHLAVLAACGLAAPSLAEEAKANNRVGVTKSPLVALVGSLAF